MHPRGHNALAWALAIALASCDAPCPDGASPAGAEPPQGDVTWCTLDDGTLHGPWRSYDPANGALLVEGTYERGMRVGRWTRRDPDGTIREETTWADDRPHGPYAAFHPDGAVAEEGQHTDGARDGAWRELHPDGTLAAEGRYRQDLPEPGWRYADANGVEQPCPAGAAPGTEGACTLEDGTLHGPFTVDLGGGQLLASARDGEPHGWWRVEDATGAVTDELEWRQGLLLAWIRLADGVEVDRVPLDEQRRLSGWRVTRVAGDAEWRSTWQAGVRDGPSVVLRDGGAPIQEGMWAGGAPTGSWRWWDADGQLVATATLDGWSLTDAAARLDGAELPLESGCPADTERVIEGALTACRDPAGLLHGPSTIARDGGVELGLYDRAARHGLWLTRSSTHAGLTSAVVQDHGRPFGVDLVRDPDGWQATGWAESWPVYTLRADPAGALTADHHADGRGFTWRSGRLVSAEPGAEGLRAVWDGSRLVLSGWREGAPDGLQLTLAKGAILEAGRWVDGVREGVWTRWDSDGQPSTTGAYVGGLPDGPWRVRVGEATAAGAFAGGLPDGAWAADGVTCPDGAAPVAIGDPFARHALGCADRAGALHGPWSVWRADGVPLGTGTAYHGEPASLGKVRPLEARALRDGAPDGPFTASWPNGAVWLSGSYLDGWRHGPWTVRMADGTVAAEGSWRTGQRSGQWRFSLEPGTTFAAGAFDDGRPVGRWTAQLADREVTFDLTEDGAVWAEPPLRCEGPVRGLPRPLGYGLSCDGGPAIMPVGVRSPPWAAVGSPSPLVATGALIVDQLTWHADADGRPLGLAGSADAALFARRGLRDGGARWTLDHGVELIGAYREGQRHGRWTVSAAEGVFASEDVVAGVPVVVAPAGGTPYTPLVDEETARYCCAARCAADARAPEAAAEPLDCAAECAEPEALLAYGWTPTVPEWAALIAANRGVTAELPRVRTELTTCTAPRLTDAPGPAELLTPP